MIGKISDALAAALAAYAGKRAKVRPQAPSDRPQSRQAEGAEEALNALKSANASRKQQRKAAAKAEVDRLKKELENLRLWGGDPKAVARRAAQISRQLASAAKEYVASGGQAGMGLSVAEMAAPDASEADGADDRDHLVGQYRQQAAEIQQKGSEHEEDVKFASEVRRLYALTKSIMAEQRRRAEAEGKNDEEMERMAREVDTAEADLTRSFGDSALAAVAVPLALRV